MAASKRQQAAVSCFVPTPPQTDKSAAWGHLYSYERHWYSSQGFLTYLPCDVKASPGGLVSVAPLRAGGEFTNWCGSLIKRRHFSGSPLGVAGSAHFHHHGHYEKLLFTCSIILLGTKASWDIYCILKVEYHCNCGLRTCTDMWRDGQEGRNV